MASDIAPHRDPTPTARSFEMLVRGAFEKKYATPLPEGRVEGVPKRWDFLSDDKDVVGDAKFYALVGGTGYPSAKMSAIAEHVWLLTKVPARKRFLAFGNEIKVPSMWLGKYGHLVDGIEFWFLDGTGNLHHLNP